MYELSRSAISEALPTSPTWILPLSAGLDSRLIAAVCADGRVDVRAYTWGNPESVDVVFASQIASALGLPWQYVDVGTDYLCRYTQRWASMFSTALHFHGMYQMAFLDAVPASGPALTGFVGDALTDVSLFPHDNPARCQFADQWHTHWTADEIKTLLKVPVADALDEVTAEFGRQLREFPGAAFQRATLVELWSRQRRFISFQTTLADYWRGSVAPFMNRDYARFCLSLPRIALDGRQLLADMYRRHYGTLATIPGTYGAEPFVRTGRYLIKRRLAQMLPAAIRRGPLRGFVDIPTGTDTSCVRATGRAALWPLGNEEHQLSDLLDLSQLSRAYEQVIASPHDVRPLRKLQSVQALAHGLLARGRSLALTMVLGMPDLLEPGMLWALLLGPG
jgi:hypothetical protein